MQPLKNLKQGRELIGKSFEVVRDTSGHGIPIGTKVKLFTVGMIGSSVVFYMHESDEPLRARDINPVGLTIEELEKELQELKEETLIKSSDLEDKIYFMKDKELEIFNEEDYHIYKTLKLIEEAKDPSEKERLLKLLVNK